MSMGVYIKGMEMPKNGYDCPMCKDGMCIIPGKDSDGICLSFGPYEEKRPNDCPLIEVPEPHGRLIDADVLHKLFEDQWHYLQVLDWNENPTAEAVQSGINWCINTMHDDAPTIIPASEEG